MDEQPKKKTKRLRADFTLLEFLIAVSIFALLLALFWTSDRFSHPGAKQVICASNLHCLGMDLMAESDDNAKKLSQDWCDIVKSESENEYPDVFKCPADKKSMCNYSLNKNTIGLEADKLPDDIVFLFESKPGWNQVGGPELLATKNHLRKKKGNEGANILFGDGHTEFIKTKKFSKLKWTME
jgi:prepilin-type processing-associated H-X9-DG protein